MAFLRTANALVVKPQVTNGEWSRIRTASTVQQQPLQENLIARASEIFETTFNPADYLLTHASIVCSVDSFTPTNTPDVVDGFRPNRKYPNWRITEGTQKYINGNMDAWDRAVLLKSFQTFIGAQNYQEHVQIEEFSKGRIIDAVARDIGDSIYIDILIATSRKHTQLIKDITSGRMSSLSMGCSTVGTKCTRCGHWAADETELCPHIRHQKGNTFFDDAGHQFRIAELCGDESLDSGGVVFVEASWVANPAFGGAVLRNIITAPSAEAMDKAAQVLSTPPANWIGNKKANRELVGWGDEGDEASFGDAGGEGGDAAAPAEPPKDPDPLEDAEKSLEEHLINTVKQRVQERMKKPAPNDTQTTSTNDNIVKQAYLHITKTASNDADLVEKLASFNNTVGVNIPVGLYRAALLVGMFSKYASKTAYIDACEKALARKITAKEFLTIGRISQLLDAHNGQRRARP